MSESEPTGESITAEGLKQLRAEVDDLEGRGRREMAARIKVARELGDLKENAEYHIAKEDQGHLETKITRLRRRLRDAVVVDVDEDNSSFAFGRTAEVTDQEGKAYTWTIVGPTEADMSAGRLSAESPVGGALRDAAVGAEVEVDTPRGTRTFKVVKLLD